MWPYPWTHVGTPSHLGHMDRVAATMPSQAHAGAAQEAPDIGQWEGQDVPMVRPSSCNVKGGIPSSRRYLPTYLPVPFLQNEVPLMYMFLALSCCTINQSMELIHTAVRNMQLHIDVDHLLLPSALDGPALMHSDDGTPSEQ